MERTNTVGVFQRLLWQTQCQSFSEPQSTWIPQGQCGSANSNTGTCEFQLASRNPARACKRRIERCPQEQCEVEGETGWKLQKRNLRKEGSRWKCEEHNCQQWVCDGTIWEGRRRSLKRFKPSRVEIHCGCKFPVIIPLIPLILLVLWYIPWIILQKNTDHPTDPID